MYDIAFAKGVNVFASVGADGSVRMFDLRNLEHSTIIYETGSGGGEAPSPQDALLRLRWNKQDSNFLAAMKRDASKVVVLDIRVPSRPIAELDAENYVNGLCWAPHSSCHLCTVGDDKRALIWDIRDIAEVCLWWISIRIRMVTVWGERGEFRNDVCHSLTVLQPQKLLEYTAPGILTNVEWSATVPNWIAVAVDDEGEGSMEILRV